MLIVNVILSRMIHAMKRGREVEFPFGKLKRVKRHFSKLWDAIDDWPADRDPYTIGHEVDEAGDRELHPWAWPKTGAADVRSRRSLNSSSSVRRKGMEVNPVCFPDAPQVTDYLADSPQARRRIIDFR